MKKWVFFSFIQVGVTIRAVWWFGLFENKTRREYNLVDKLILARFFSVQRPSIVFRHRVSLRPPMSQLLRAAEGSAIHRWCFAVTHVLTLGRRRTAAPIGFWFAQPSGGSEDRCVGSVGQRQKYAY